MLSLLLALVAQAAASGLVAQGPTLTLDGAPYQIFSGSVHYFRTRPEYWADILGKAKAAGLNTITTYVPWNLHEPQPGVFDFTGMLDLGSFLSLAQRTGLKVIFRPGPYICAEWEWGGHPYWLLKDPDMKVRTMYPGYTSAVEAYFARLLPIVLPHLHANGGPVIAVQVENEYGAYGWDQVYLTWMEQLLINSGITELLFTSDGPPWLANGTLPGLYTVVNFQENPAQALGALKAYQPDRPLMVGEFWSGWFDHWGQKHHAWPVAKFEANLRTILEMGASFNLYMFHGGTNFGFLNGANKNYTVYDPFPDSEPGYQPTITSYDYDAPVSEEGRTTAKYFVLQKLMTKYNPDFQLTQDLKKIAEKDKLPDKPIVAMSVPKAADTYLTLLDALTEIKPVKSANLHNMEYFNQGLGYIAYRTTLAGPGRAVFVIFIADRAQILVNGAVVRTVYNTFREGAAVQFSLQLPAGSVDLVLLCENLGRANYDMHPQTLDTEGKGIRGYVQFQNNFVPSWLVYSLTLDSAQMALLGASNRWQVPSTGVSAQTMPTFYRFNYTAPDKYSPKLPFVDLHVWNHGAVFVNGFNLGRYWVPMGPGTTLYCPPSLLNAGSANDVIVWELDGAGDALAFVGAPNYGPSCDMPCFWNNKEPGMTVPWETAA